MKAATLPLQHWIELHSKVKRSFPSFAKLTGWHFDTLWIDGTPAPVISSWLRLGNGLIENPPTLEK